MILTSINTLKESQNKTKIEIYLKSSYAIFNFFIKMINKKSAILTCAILK